MPFSGQYMDPMGDDPCIAPFFLTKSSRAEEELKDLKLPEKSLHLGSLGNEKSSLLGCPWK